MNVSNSTSTANLPEWTITDLLKQRLERKKQAEEDFDKNLPEVIAAVTRSVKDMFFRHLQITISDPLGNNKGKIRLSCSYDISNRHLLRDIERDFCDVSSTPPFDEWFKRVRNSYYPTDTAYIQSYIDKIMTVVAKNLQEIFRQFSALNQDVGFSCNISYLFDAQCLFFEAQVAEFPAENQTETHKRQKISADKGV